MEIKEFVINRLYGSQNIRLIFSNNNLIMVGENGASKTTVMKIFFYTLTCQWEELSSFDFVQVVLKTDTDTISVEKKEIAYMKKKRKMKDRLSPSFRNRLRSSMRNSIDRSRQEILLDELISNESMNRILSSIEMELPLKNEIRKKERRINKITKSIRIIYLPTYRRIENRFQNLNSEIFSNVSDSFTQNYQEVTEFGMDDVEENINKELELIDKRFRINVNRLNAKYLSSVVMKQYESKDVMSHIRNISRKKVESVLNRIDMHDLSQDTKDELSKIILEVKKGNKNNDIFYQIVSSYFMQLVSFYDELIKSHEKIQEFYTICNSYLRGKQFVYDEKKSILNIISSSNSKLDLNCLSSGEKQIVSLFSYIYLFPKKIFVIIDEPELSLSIDWQKRILSDMAKGSNFMGLFAVTHSPYVISDDLMYCAHGIKSFNFNE